MEDTKDRVTSNVKVQLEFDDETSEVLNRLKNERNSTLSQILGEAIGLYEFLHNQVKDNYKIQAVKKQGLRQTIREIQLK